MCGRHGWRLDLWFKVWEGVGASVGPTFGREPALKCGPHLLTHAPLPFALRHLQVRQYRQLREGKAGGTTGRYCLQRSYGS